MTESFISIIIPSYNSEKTIEKAVKSIYKQQHNNFEVVIINDGSTDNSPELCKNFAAKDKRIRVFHNKTSQGVSSARNKGIMMSKGDYITFLDSDDELAPNFFKSAFSESDWDVWVGNVARRIDGIINCRSIPKFEFEGIGNALTEEQICAGYNCICCCYAKIFKRKVVQSIRFNESMSFGEDGMFSFEAILKQDINCVFRNIDVYFYNFGHQGLASKFNEGRMKDMVTLNHWLVNYGNQRGFSKNGLYWKNVIDGRILEELYYTENFIIRSESLTKKQKNFCLDILIKDSDIRDSISRASTIAYKYPKLWIVKDYFQTIKKRLFRLH